MKIPLFDIDGTLIEMSDNFNDLAYSSAFKKVYGKNASKDDTGTIRGRIQNQIFMEIMLYHGVSEETIVNKLDEATKVMSEEFLKAAKNFKFKLLPGVLELLETLKKERTHMGILTGNNKEVTEFKLKVAGISKFVDFAAYGDEAFQRFDLVQVAKERAEKIIGRKILNEEFAIIGDTPNDINTGKKTGIKVIAVASGNYSAEQLAEHKPDLLIKTLEEKEMILSFLEH